MGVGRMGGVRGGGRKVVGSDIAQDGVGREEDAEGGKKVGGDFMWDILYVVLGFESEGILQGRMRGDIPKRRANSWLGSCAIDQWLRGCYSWRDLGQHGKALQLYEG